MNSFGFVQATTEKSFGNVQLIMQSMRELAEPFFLPRLWQCCQVAMRYTPFLRARH